MAESVQPLEDLDPEVRAVIAGRCAALKERAQLNQSIEQATLAIRKRRRERDLHALGDELSAAIERLRVVAGEVNADTTALVDAMRATIASSEGSTSARVVSPPPMVVSDDRLVAVLSPYFVYEISAEAGFLKGEQPPSSSFGVFMFAVGDGLGWGDGDRRSGTVDVTWLFRFVPPRSGFYDFFPTTGYFGDIMLVSDDSVGTSSDAHASFYLRGAVWHSGTPDAVEKILDEEHDDDTHVYQLGSAGGGGEAQLHLRSFLQEGSPTTVALTHELYAYARSAWAQTSIDFDDPRHGLGPVWCYVF